MWPLDVKHDRFFDRNLYDGDVESAFVKLAQTVIFRDKYTCIDCAFKSNSDCAWHGYMYIYPNDNSSGITTNVSDYSTYCPFCLAQKNYRAAAKSNRYFPVIIDIASDILPKLVISSLSYYHNKNSFSANASEFFRALYNSAFKLSTILPDIVMSDMPEHNEYANCKLFNHLNAVVYASILKADANVYRSNIEGFLQEITFIPIPEKFKDEGSSWYESIFSKASKNESLIEIITNA